MGVVADQLLTLLTGGAARELNAMLWIDLTRDGAIERAWNGKYDGEKTLLFLLFLR